MNQLRTAFLLVLLLPASAGAHALAAVNVNAVVGGRIMDEEEWEPVDNPPALGVNADFGLFGWPVNIALGLHASTAEDRLSAGGSRVDVTETVVDVSAGVIRSWTVAGNIHPYVGGGVAFVQAEKEVDPPGSSKLSGDDSSPALYLDWGLTWRLGYSFNLGLTGRFVAGTDLSFGDEDFNADHFQGGLILGWGRDD